MLKLSQRFTAKTTRMEFGEAIPQLFIRRTPFPVERSDDEFISQLTNELSAAWGNTYYITPDMLKKEIKLSSLRSLK